MSTSDLTFDPASGQFVPSATSLENTVTSDQPATDPIATEFSPALEDDFAFTDTPGGTVDGTLQPPDTFYVLEQNVRVMPNGVTLVDVVIQIDDGNAYGNEYEYRISQ